MVIFIHVLIILTAARDGVKMETKDKVINGMCFAVLGYLGFYLAMFQRILDEIGMDYSLNKVLMGLVVAAHFGGLLLGPLVAGELSDKFGRRIVILNAFVFFLAGLAVVLVSKSIIIVIAGIFLTGIGFGILEGAMVTLLTDITPTDTNKVINISQMFFSLGTVAGPFLAMGMISVTGDWKFLFGAGIAVILLFLVAFKKYKYPDCRVTEKIEGTITVMLLKQKTFIILCISMIMYVGVEEGMAFWITTYVKEWTRAAYYPSIVLSLFWGSMIIGRYIVSRFSTRLNEIIIGSMAFSGIFLVVSVLSNSFTVNIIAFFLIGFGFSGIWPMIMALAKIHFPRYAGTAFGIMMACCAVGGLTVPFIMGYIGEAASMKWALAFCLVPLIVIAFNHLILKGQKG